MIKGVHAMFYSAEAEALRAFLRDKLKISHTDVGDGWLIFDVAEGDIGVHPTGHPGSPASGTHNVSFYCDDLESTVAQLRATGVEFSDGITDQGYGLVTHFRMPGGVEVELYQPRYRKDRPRFESAAPIRKVKKVAARAKKAVKKAAVRPKKPAKKARGRASSKRR